MDTLSLIGQLAVDGLAMGFVYVLLSAGLVFIMSISGIFYIAYGQFYMMGAFATWALVTALKLPFVVALVVATLLMGALGLLSYRLVFQYTTYSPNKFMANIVAAIGLLLIFSQAGFLLLGSSTRSLPTVFSGQFNLLGIYITTDKLMLMVISVVIVVLLFLFYERTRMGRAMRAVSILPEAATLMGINTRAIYMTSVGIGCAMAGFAGGLIAPSYGIVPEMGNSVIALVLLIAMFGGIDSLMGSVVAGIIIGMILSYGQYFIGSYAQILVFVIVGVVIVFRPGGLLGRREYGL
jgi:branched-chain amino acid transport system permease protein